MEEINYTVFSNYDRATTLIKESGLGEILRLRRVNAALYNENPVERKQRTKAKTNL
jgi:hypothetical protein